MESEKLETILFWIFAIILTAFFSYGIFFQDYDGSSYIGLVFILWIVNDFRY